MRFATVCRRWREVAGYVALACVEPQPALIEYLDARPRSWTRIQSVILDWHRNVYLRTPGEARARYIAAVLRSARRATLLSVACPAARLDDAFTRHSGLAVNEWTTASFTIAAKDGAVGLESLLRVLQVLAPTLRSLDVWLGWVDAGVIAAAEPWPRMPRLVELDIADAPYAYVPAVLRAAGPVTHLLLSHEENAEPGDPTALEKSWPSTLQSLRVVGGNCALPSVRDIITLRYLELVLPRGADAGGTVRSLPAGVERLYLSVAGEAAAMVLCSLMALILAPADAAADRRLARLRRLTIRVRRSPSHDDEDSEGRAGADDLTTLAEAALRSACRARDIGVAVSRKVMAAGALF